MPNGYRNPASEWLTQAQLGVAYQAIGKSAETAWDFAKAKELGYP